MRSALSQWNVSPPSFSQISTTRAVEIFNHVFFEILLFKKSLRRLASCQLRINSNVVAQQSPFETQPRDKNELRNSVDDFPTHINF